MPSAVTTAMDESSPAARGGAATVDWPRWVWPLLVGAAFWLLFQDWILRAIRVATNARGTTTWEVLTGIFSQSWNPDWSHILIIPLISLYYIRLHQHELAASRPDVSWRPLEIAIDLGAVLVVGLWLLFVAGYGQRMVDAGAGFLRPLFASSDKFAFALRGPLIVGAWTLLLFSRAMHAMLWRPMLDRLGLPIDAASWMRMSGLVILLTGIANYMYWIYPGRNDMLQGYSVVLALFGLVLLCMGPDRMRVLWFPVLFLVFSVKIAQRQWEMIAWQLQWIASRAAGALLTMSGPITGLEARVDGSTIELYQGVQELGKLNVAEACAGLRMLMAFLALGVAMAFLFDRAWWQRLIMVGMTVPIALAVNIGRVTTLGFLYPINPELASGDFHTFIGMLMLIPAALMFMGLGWVLDQIVIREGEADEPARRTGDARPAEVAAPRADLWRLGRGVLAGVGLMGLMGLGYGLVVAYSRPELLPFGLTLTSGVALATAASAAILAGVGWVGWQALRSRGSTPPRFGLTLGVAVGVLLAAASGLYGVVSANELVLTYKPIDLRHKLFMLPEQLQGWKMVSEDPPLTAEVREALGTDDYISRVYRDLALPESDGGGFARVHIAYYTNTPDTVPHVPDRCYVAGGVQPVDVSKVTLTLGGPGYHTDEQGRTTALSKLHGGSVRVPRTDIPATIFTFTTPESGGRQGNVIYFFSANGKFLPTPEAVRAQGFGLRDRYSYYCKIEVGFFGVDDPQRAVQRTSEVLSAMMPEILAALPDWVEVTRMSRQAESDQSQPAEADRARF